MPAVAIAAIDRKPGDFVEALAERVLVYPELELTDTRAIDQKGASWNHEELSMGRGVLTEVIA